jgi:hypothetical protein
MTPIHRWENLRYLIKKWASVVLEAWKKPPYLNQQKGEL